jgi:hypothetical protein
LNRLIRGSIQAGLLAVIFAAGNAFAFRIAPHSFAYLVFAITIGRAFSITIFDTLLSRKTLKNLLMRSRALQVKPYPLQALTTDGGIRIETQTVMNYDKPSSPDVREDDTKSDVKEGSLQDGIMGGKMVSFPGNENIV